MGTLNKITVLDKVEILEDGSLQVRMATYITEDDKRITQPEYQRVAYVPGADLPFDTPDRVKDVAKLIWTPEVIDAHKKKLEAAPARPPIPAVIPVAPPA